MIEVGEALEQLVHGGTLVHHFDAVALQDGGHDTDLVERATDQARETTFVETLGGLLGDVDRLPSDALPAAREAAMRIVRRIAAPTPPPGDTAPEAGDEDAWWQLDRHHGMGDVHNTARSPTTPVSSGSGESHRRRRLLGVHSKHL